MNPFVLFLLNSILPILENAVATEGAAAIEWLESKLAGFKTNTPVTPSPLPSVPSPVVGAVQAPSTAQPSVQPSAMVAPAEPATEAHKDNTWWKEQQKNK